MRKSGAYLLGVWGLNGLTVEAVAHHHRPTRILHHGLDCAAATYLASLITSEIDHHPEDVDATQISDHDKECLETLGLLAWFPILKTRAAELLFSATSR